MLRIPIYLFTNKISQKIRFFFQGYPPIGPLTLSLTGIGRPWGVATKRQPYKKAPWQKGTLQKGTQQKGTLQKGTLW